MIKNLTINEAIKLAKERNGKFLSEVYRNYSEKYECEWEWTLLIFKYK